MAVKIRLARVGRTSSPSYRMAAADSRSPRDGRYIELLGTYSPLLEKGHANRVILKKERITHWLNCGAIPTIRVRILLEQAGILNAQTRSNPKKAKPKTKALERLAAKDKAKETIQLSKSAEQVIQPTDKEESIEQVMDKKEVSTTVSETSQGIDAKSPTRLDKTSEAEKENPTPKEDSNENKASIE